ncbi:NAD-dependent epimerase/dehydratase family protein [Chloroflexota bacterium]
MSTEHYLVTGGTGCIGAWVVRNLVQAEISTTVLDFDQDYHRLELILDENELSQVKFIAGDINRLDDLIQIFEENYITKVIHLAALQLPFCKANPSLGALVNVVGTINIFEAAKRTGVRHIVYASSGAVYGPKEIYKIDPIPHEAPLFPTSHYGVYKQANELGAKVYWKNDSISSIGLRPHVVYGPGRDQGMTSTPTKAMLAAIIGRPYTVSFDGRYCVQYVDDAAKVFIRASQTAFDGADVFNIGGEAPSSTAIIREIEIAIPSISGKLDTKSFVLPFPEDFDNGALKAILGYFQQTSLREGVQQTIKIYKLALQKGCIKQSQIDNILSS